MKHIPILFSAPMMKANLAGTKDVTRRICKLPNHPAVKSWELHDGHFVAVPHSERVQQQYITSFPFGRYGHRYGAAGDVLWAKETFWMHDDPNAFPPNDGNVTDDQGRRRVVGYAASMDADSVRCAMDYGARKRPSIHMPRWACRFEAQIVSVRVERLHEITVEDAIREGVESLPASQWYPTWRDTYRELWQSINGDGSWELNPWVYRIEYKNPHKEYRS